MLLLPFLLSFSLCGIGSSEALCLVFLIPVEKKNTRSSHAKEASHLQCFSCPRPRRRPRIINAATTAHTPARQAMLPVMPSLLARAVCRQIFDRAPTFDRFTHRSFFVCPVPCPCNTKPIMEHMICLYRILPMALCVAS